MNLDICKKCNCKPVIYFHIICKDAAYLICTKEHYMFDVGNINTELAEDIKKYLKMEGYMESKVAAEFLPNIFLKDIEINKNCPYYIEYQLSKWNEK